MAAPTPVSPLPAAPSRADGPVIFNQRADPFIAALPPMVVQFNLNITWVGQQVATIGGYATAAAQSATDAAAAADRAEAVDTNVSEQVAQATAAANNAAASATAAESAQGSIGNLALIHSLTIGMMRRF